MKIKHLIAVFLLAGSLYAATTFDNSSGVGYVDAATLMQSFSWNPSTLNNRAAQITFSYDNYSWYFCTCSTPNGSYGQSIVVSSTIPVSSTIQYQGGSVIGANIGGYSGPEVDTGATPQLGDNCSVIVRRNKYAGTLTSVMNTGGTSGLYGRYAPRNQMAQLWP